MSNIDYHAPEEVITAPGHSEPVLIVRRDRDDGPLIPPTWEVWLEPHARAHAVGLCVGTGVTRALALADASRTLNGLAIEALLAIQSR